MNEMLLIDCVGYATLELTESSHSGNLRFRGKFQEANAINKNKRIYTYEALASNVEKLEETVAARGLYGECDHPCLTDPNFNVLTINGWKPFTEIRTGDYVYSRVDGKMVKSRVNAIIDQPYDGHAYKIKGRSIDCTTTPAHRFLLSSRQDCKKINESYATIEEIHNNRKKYGHHAIPKTANWGGEKHDKFLIPGVSRGKRSRKYYSESLVIDTKKFAAFLGIYLAEGCVNKVNGIFIARKTETGKAIIKELLDNLHPDIKWKVHENYFYATDARLHDYLVPLGNKYNKYVPKEVKNLSPEYLEELIHWFAIGDGRSTAEGSFILMQMSEGAGKPFLNCKSPNLSEERLNLGAYSRTSIFSVSKRLIDDLHECLVKTGRNGSRSIILPENDYVYAGRAIKAENKHPLYQLEVCRSKYIHTDPRFLHITQVHHTGRIYCLTTEHGNFYMEHKGHSFWTGNSDSIIHLTSASHIITKLWWQNNTLMGEAEILPTPNGMILKRLIESNCRIGISSRGVGNGQTNSEGVLVIGENYKLVTFDAVADPSTYSAFQKQFKKEHFEPIIKQPVFESIPTRTNYRTLVSFFGTNLDVQLEAIKQRIRNK